MNLHTKANLALLATTLSACTQVPPESPGLAADEGERMTCKKEAPIDSHVKVFECRPVNKPGVTRGSPAIAAEPGQEVPLPEGKCGSE
jgi:hypothetical protein